MSYSIIYKKTDTLKYRLVVDGNYAEIQICTLADQGDFWVKKFAGSIWYNCGYQEIIDVLIKSNMWFLDGAKC